MRARSRVVVRVAAVAAVLAAAVAVPASAGAAPIAAGSAVRSAVVTPVPVSAPTLRTAVAAPRVADAVRLRVPRLGINRSMIRLHVQSDRSLTVPKSFADIGWWSEGPKPGAAGATIVGGHISSKAGPGAFFSLAKLRVRDLIAVDRADGTTALFQVRSVQSYPRSSYPNALVYRTAGRSSIHLITCDGAFDPRIGHHVNNLVVFADLVQTRRTAA